ncbi:PREDICTED: uncharacterized protein LOC103325945 isoform X1 [Prunus mume]|uniref:Uncharacterized protein LOC103325945 isoform X1 n=1 Tax=Prunus mume TaxID=102107 RepID=A0ABM0NL06_PRUMU|nr:PREDICTED: uncharacterized protein LOC103325945 isoform X1 [Prunus mume]
MNFYSIFLLILVCHDLLPYSSLATRKLQDVEETNKVRKSSSNDDFQDKVSSHCLKKPPIMSKGKCCTKYIQDQIPSVILFLISRRPTHHYEKLPSLFFPLLYHVPNDYRSN